MINAASSEQSTLQQLIAGYARPWPLGVCLAIGAVSLALVACGDSSDTPDETSAQQPSGGIAATPEPTGPSAGLELLFNDPLTNEAPLESTASPIGSRLIHLIKGAERSIEFAIYGLRNQPEIIRALESAKNRGVRVRGIVDRDLNGDNYYSDTDLLVKRIPSIKDDWDHDKATALKSDNRKSRPFWPAPKGFEGPPQCIGYSLPANRAIIAVHASREPLEFAGDIMHHKFFVVDGRHVWTGSCNLSDSGTGGYNANIAAVIDSASVAGWYTGEFEQMYERGLFHRSKTVHGRSTHLTATLNDGGQLAAHFSPQGYAMIEGVRPILQRAKKSINVSVFFLTHKYITGDLIKAHQRGVQVRVIIDATAAKNGYTKHEILRAAGIPVKVENWGGKMHMKAASVDGRHLIMGSMNWTSAGERSNDENTLIISAAQPTTQYDELFEKLWSSIPDRWLQGRPDPESRDSGTSWRDGVDNDFDGLIDLKDPGCRADPPELPPLPPFRIVPKTDGFGLIKGNINRERKRYYFLPTDKYYDRTQIDVSKGERWFPSISEARDAGWTRFGR